MNNKIKIGYGNNGETVYLEKHSWDCDWYWAFGYLNTADMHFHFSSMVPNQSDRNEIKFDLGFDEPYTVKLDPRLNGWELMELFSQAYALKEYYEMFYRGGCGISVSDIGIKKDLKRAEMLKTEIGALLDEIWNYINKNIKG